ncbi:MAG TPA: hypothetical protein VGK94_02060 [Candidatus Polarisedimenticolia bacterium]
MRRANPVLFSLILSLLLSSGARIGSPLNGPGQAAAEPSGPLSAAVTLVAVRDTSEGRSALLRINLISHSGDAEAVIFALDSDRKIERGQAAARASLPKDQAKSALVETEVLADQETHLFYRVMARGLDGSSSQQDLYFRVPPRESLDCQTEGDYIQCEGAAVAEVQP